MLDIKLGKFQATETANRVSTVGNKIFTFGNRPNRVALRFILSKRMADFELQWVTALIGKHQRRLFQGEIQGAVFTADELIG